MATKTQPEAHRPGVAGDFRTDPMPSPEGMGKARTKWQKAWDAYVKALAPAVEPVARVIGRELTFDLMGFWLTWHLHGGFEGMQRDLGMSRSAVYRRVSAFRRATGKHPDEFQLPGVRINAADYLAGQVRIATVKAS
jgi:hypothetical protein